MTSCHPRNILLVEDNPGDVLMIREALDVLKVSARIHVATNGDEGIGYLNDMLNGGGKVRPDLVLLDLNLPGRSGREILEEIERNPRLHGLVVAVYTSSAHEQRVCSAYNLSYCGYFQKPPMFTQVVECMQAIMAFWHRATTRGRTDVVHDRPAES